MAGGQAPTSTGPVLRSPEALRLVKGYVIEHASFCLANALADRIAVAAGFLFWAPQSLWALLAGRGHFSHDFHVSVGIVALALVLARLLRLALLGRPMAYLRGPKTGRTIQLVGLILVLSVAVSGYFALR